MRALLVGISLENDPYDIDYSLAELKSLAEALDIEVVEKMYQKLERPNAKTYVGSGKLNEIIIAIHAYDIDVLIFNDELSPSQIRNIEELTKIEVIDRSYLILKIFEQRSQTKESYLEIKLAKDLYLLPRVQFLREKEDRIGGGGLTKGKGETQKELDQRHLRNEIVRIKDELERLQKMKSLQVEKRKRNDIPIVALVGYTNAGKSTTMNTILDLCGAKEEKKVLSKDQLFATLSTFNRKVTYNKVDFMLVDTIGFVSKLPHNLINSFYQTLEEVKNADLIIHVLDSSSPYINSQLMVVLNVLYSLNANKIPTIYLFNKWDKTINPNLSMPGAKSLYYSNKTKENLNELMNIILEYVTPSTIRSKILIPYSKGDLANLIEVNCHIYEKEYQAYGTYYDCEIPMKMYSIFHEYDLDTMVS
ncbi:GTP-binding protein HflX [Anaeroplasma bactoclasticum]|jgi:GTP-binding protein HflX|uniref:GTPase HflX n=1 Tax=Anaeroplasma bactoclasticum TaxID=2088 RepID=A0A397R399_9MOLU|nr:GTPase HflX [Anaeroplasma bactoclasticum]RIA64891.1 GTP-binding protein HflX [Anaeroplasma bactoclasticum]